MALHAPILTELVVIFGAALVVSALSHRLKIPSLAGFLLTGILIGPHGLGLVSESSDVETFAELGVVFMLFIIGLEMSFAELRRLGRLLVVGGGLQVGLTLGGAALAALAMGADWRLALFIGFVVALSSTAIVLKLYTDRREIEAPHGHIALGILLFQDILIVPMLLSVPLLAGGGEVALGQVGLRFLQGIGVMAAVVGLGRYVMPWILGQIVRTRIRELFVLGSLFACLATGLLTEKAGLSMALGAFLAGVALATSDYRHQVLSEIASFRDVFNSIFFISIGMLLSLPFAIAHVGEILALSGAILVGKAVVIFLVARWLRFPSRTAIIAALGLCQIGEFSFVLIRAGEAQGLLPAELYSLLIAAAVSTMLLTPALMAIAPWLARRFGGRVGEVPEAGAEAREIPHEGHVVIGGFGLNGRHLARVLEEGHIPYCIVDSNGARVAEMHREGRPILYGDLTRVDILEAAGIETARMAVFALSDPPALRQAVLQARRLAPELYIVVRSERAEEIDELTACGADEVVGKDLETSIELVTRVLERLRLPDNVVRNAARVLRSDQYRALRTPSQRTAVSETLLDVLAAGAVQTFFLESHHPLVGETIAASELRRKTGATVLAVLRADQAIPNPSPDLAFEAGDTLVLVGSHAALEAALRSLEGLGTALSESA